jgi:signal transduction histidine kinase/FixJ family two-component response regulator
LVSANTNSEGNRAAISALVRTARSWRLVRSASLGCALLALVTSKLLELAGPLLWSAIGLCLLSLAVAGLAHTHQHILLQFAELQRLNQSFHRSAERLLDDMAVSLHMAPKENQLATELLETRRTELLPHLAASITHDENNLLSVIRGATDMVAYALPDDHPAREDLNTVREAVSQLTELNRQLLAWSRPGSAGNDPGSPSDTVQQLEPALKRLAGRKTELNIELEDIAEPLSLSAQDFSQILIQLVLNAKEAVGTNGKIRIAVSHADNDTVLLVVEDNGNGIAPTLQSKVFEPFFTTKTERQHPGLGLSSVKAMVERVGGRVALAPSLHESGTRVTVHLPKAKDLSMTAIESTRFPNGTKPNLLVLDDEETVRRLLVRLLTRDGYTITEASTLPEALKKASDAGRLDVWVTDANVEGTDATTGIAAMRELHPNLAIVLISGREPDPDRMEVLTAQGVRFLAKPFAPAELRQAIDEAYLHGSATSAVVPLPQDSTQRTVQQGR